MAQTRDIQVMTRLEPTIAVAMQQHVRDLGVSLSTYIRGLIIQDLHSNGCITQKALISMLSVSNAAAIREIS